MYIILLLYITTEEPRIEEFVIKVYQFTCLLVYQFSPKTDFDVLQWKKDTCGRVVSVLARSWGTEL